MKTIYDIKSSRYGHTHHFLKNENDSNYSLVPEEKWMPIRVIYTPHYDEIEAVDVEGGPMLSIGWTNGEIVITKIFENPLGCIFFELKEV